MDDIGQWLGRLALWAAPRERKRAEQQLNRAYVKRMSRKRLRILITGVATGLGRNLVELIRLMDRDKWPPVHLSQQGKEVLDNALAKGNGVIFVTGHIGNWELMAAHLARLGYPIHTVVKQSYDPHFTHLIDSARRHLGVRTIFRGAPGASAAMLRALRTGGVLGFLIDQDTDVPSAYVSFFEQPTKTPIAPSTMAHRMGIPLVVGTAHRQLSGAHHIEISHIRKGRDINETTARLSLTLEARIRKHPSQWVWFHQRWKSRPKAMP